MRQENDTDLIQELYEHQDDPDEWSEEAVPIEVRPGRTSVVSFRLPTKELDALEEAASAARESISEYVRKAVALRLRDDSSNGGNAITSAGMRFNQHDTWDIWSTAPASTEQYDYTQNPRRVS
ncbi:MAG TPA: hypothetical protein VH599_15255 [Ktedonobacterales bacterium]|jgi:hypothetical protein